MSGGTYRLVQDYVSPEVIASLEELYMGARRGDVQGMAFVALLKGHRYIVNVSGLCVKEATLTRGAVMALSDHLGEVVYGRDPDETR